MFKRPLDKTRITDFLGGVAQVEVVDPADSVSMVSDSAETQIDLPPLVPSSSHARTTVVSGFLTWLRDWRVVRVWVSVGCIGVLVGWVLSKK